MSHRADGNGLQTYTATSSAPDTISDYRGQSTRWSCRPWPEQIALGRIGTGGVPLTALSKLPESATQSAKGVQLHTANSLARLWRDQGKGATSYR
jgi:hypothetical protein